MPVGAAEALAGQKRILGVNGFEANAAAERAVTLVCGGRTGLDIDLPQDGRVNIGQAATVVVQVLVLPRPVDRNIEIGRLNAPQIDTLADPSAAADVNIDQLREDFTDITSLLPTGNWPALTQTL